MKKFYQEEEMNQKISTSYSATRGATPDIIAREISALDDAISRGDFIVLRFDDKKHAGAVD